MEAQILIFLMENYDKIQDGLTPLVWILSLLFQRLFRKKQKPSYSYSRQCPSLGLLLIT